MNLAKLMDIVDNVSTIHKTQILTVLGIIKGQNNSVLLNFSGKILKSIKLLVYSVKCL